MVGDRANCAGRQCAEGMPRSGDVACRGVRRPVMAVRVTPFFLCRRGGPPAPARQITRGRGTLVRPKRRIGTCGPGPDDAFTFRR